MRRREFSIHGFPGTKLRGSSMNSVPRSPNGKRDNGWAWAGMAGRTTRASNVGVDASFTATIPKLQASAMTAGISNTWSLLWRRSRRYQIRLAMPKQARCCARESPPLMRCDTAARRRAAGLGPTGKFIVVGISADPIAVTPLQLITGERALQGSAVGTPTDSEDTMNFAELTGVRPMIETYPLEKAAEACARMMSGKAQFRVVLTM